MRALLALRPRPTAVFCANDLVALGALKACAVARVSVPRDLSIVGCDDIELAQLVTPELTTIAIPARELGARAARLLIRQLAGQGAIPAPGDSGASPRPGRTLLGQPNCTAGLDSRRDFHAESLDLAIAIYRNVVVAARR